MIMLKDDFDWQDRRVVILKAQPATAVYFNTDREIVIRQIEDDEDVIVRLQPEHALKIASAIRAIAAHLDSVECREADAVEFDFEEIEDQPRDKTAKDRQRRRRERIKAERSTQGVTHPVTVDVTVTDRDAERGSLLADAAE